MLLSLVCALDVDYNSSVVCNAIGYSNLLTFDEPTAEKSTTDEVTSNLLRTPTKISS